MSILDMIGVASILPFVTVLSSPEIVETNLILNKIFKLSQNFGVENKSDFLFALGVLAFMTLVFTLTFKAFVTYLQINFIRKCEYTISKRLIEGYLRQPYSWFLNKNTSEMGKSILSEVGFIIGNGLGPIIELLTKSMVTITILILLICFDPKMTIIILLTLGISYGLTYRFFQNYLIKIGNEVRTTNTKRFNAMLEAFGGIKELKVNGFEKEYIKRFSIPAKTFAFNQAASTVISEMPRFILESIMFGGLILIVLYLMAQSGNFTDVIPLITLYAFAGYRLMPAAQQMYGSISKLSFVKPVLDSMYNELKELNSSNLQNFNEIKAPNDRNILECRKEIILKNVIFSYPNNSRTALKNINLKISANTIIGLIGVTGSGKTTIVDVILGLLQPQNGNLEVDGQKITQDNCKLWQKTIGYVPQNIFLSDDTIASNIAFGINNENINQEAVEQAAKKAAIHEFIVNELPQKYKTIIGERGIRLSGGERQRIGIARALYSNPSVVIFDEATNALDNKTEKKVTDAISKIGNNCTIILIAHRLETVKNCDMIYLLEKGEIKDQGKFEKLIDNKQNLYGK